MLRGNLCPQGAVVKPSAASPTLLAHTGPALVFDTIEDFKARIDDPDLDVSPRHGDGAARVRPAGLSRACRRSGNMPLAGQAPRRGRRRHGAHQRRPHERHRVRHDGAARRAGVDGRADRWRSCARATRSRSTCRVAVSPSTSTTTSSTADAPSGGAAARRRARLVPPLHRSRHAGRHRLRPRLPRRRQRLERSSARATDGRAPRSGRAAGARGGAGPLGCATAG